MYLKTSTKKMVIPTKMVLFGSMPNNVKTIFFKCCYTALSLKLNKKHFVNKPFELASL
ncbi:hypothetical protein ABIB50_004876 [Mucilaginibacter sp. UYCu711]